ncbi:hypothetical protein GCM10010341_15430 [Streptomyces noursei]|nr:hypothetical protein GCM10010341_15430 [Streptomyces noursei]
MLAVNLNDLGVVLTLTAIAHKRGKNLDYRPMVFLGILHDPFEGVNAPESFRFAVGAKQLDCLHIPLRNLGFTREFGLFPILIARVLKIQMRVYQAEPSHYGSTESNKHRSEPRDHDTVGWLQVSLPDVRTVEPPWPLPEQERVAGQPEEDGHANRKATSPSSAPQLPLTPQVSDHLPTVPRDGGCPWPLREH